MQRYSIHAVDGDAGPVEQFYLDDAAWKVRCLVAMAGRLLRNRQVLIASGSMERIDAEERIFRTNLTRDQVKNAPGIEADRPVAAQREIDHHARHGVPRWGSGWEAAVPPGAPTSPAPYTDLPETAQALSVTSLFVPLPRELLRRLRRREARRALPRQRKDIPRQRRTLC